MSAEQTPNLAALAPEAFAEHEAAQQAAEDAAKFAQEAQAKAAEAVQQANLVTDEAVKAANLAQAAAERKQTTLDEYNVVTDITDPKSVNQYAHVRNIVVSNNKKAALKESRRGDATFDDLYGPDTHPYVSLADRKLDPYTLVARRGMALDPERVGTDAKGNVRIDTTTLHDIINPKTGVNLLAEALNNAEEPLKLGALAKLRYYAERNNDHDSVLTIENTIAQKLGVDGKTPLAERQAAIQKLVTRYERKLAVEAKRQAAAQTEVETTDDKVTVANDSENTAKSVEKNKPASEVAMTPEAPQSEPKEEQAPPESPVNSDSESAPEAVKGTAASEEDAPKADEPEAEEESAASTSEPNVPVTASDEEQPTAQVQETETSDNKSEPAEENGTPSDDTATETSTEESAEQRVDSKPENDQLDAEALKYIDQSATGLKFQMENLGSRIMAKKVIDQLRNKFGDQADAAIAALAANFEVTHNEHGEVWGLPNPMTSYTNLEKAPLSPETGKLQVSHGVAEQSKNDPSEDTILVNQPSQMYGVFDGVGGHEGGEIASKAARDAFYEHLRSLPYPRSVAEANEQMADAFEYASSKVAEASPLGAATTANVMQLWMIDGRQYASIGNAGDSRMVLYRNGQLFNMTPDQSEVHVAHNALPKQEHFLPNVVQTFQLLPGDKLLMASDGITGDTTRQKLKVTEFIDAFNADTAQQSAQNFLDVSRKYDDKLAIVLFFETADDSSTLNASQAPAQAAQQPADSSAEAAPAPLRSDRFDWDYYSTIEDAAYHANDLIKDAEAAIGLPIIADVVNQAIKEPQVSVETIENKYGINAEDSTRIFKWMQARGYTQTRRTPGEGYRITNTKPFEIPTTANKAKDDTDNSSRVTPPAPHTPAPVTPAAQPSAKPASQPAADGGTPSDNGPAPAKPKQTKVEEPATKVGKFREGLKKKRANKNESHEEKPLNRRRKLTRLLGEAMMAAGNDMALTTAAYQSYNQRQLERADYGVQPSRKTRVAKRSGGVALTEQSINYSRQPNEYTYNGDNDLQELLNREERENEEATS